MLEPTKTKFYKFDDIGVPDYKGLYLDMTTLFDTVLVNGFNLKTPQTFLITDKVLTITFALDHGYLAHQVILITGANVEMYNREFRINTIPTSKSLTILLDDTFTSVPTNAISIQIKNAPLGYSKKFEAEGKRVYTSPHWDVAMKLDDYQHPDWSATWAKFARLQFATNYSDVDTPIGNYYPERDLRTITTYAGQTYKFWTNVKLYLTRSPSSTTEESNSSASTATKRSWYIFGDAKGFYFIRPHSSTSSYTTKDYYLSSYIGTFNRWIENDIQFPKGSVFANCDYNNYRSNVSTAYSEINMLCVDTNSYTTHGIIAAPTVTSSWYRLKPFLNLGQSFSGTPIDTSSSGQNSRLTLQSDILSDVFV